MSSSKFGTIVRSLATLVLALIASTSALGYEQIVYYHNDLAGSPIGATDQSGNVVWKESYAPYGQRLRNQDNTNKVWFHGKPADIETGLSYFGARYYDPVIGRFMGPDPAGYDEKNIHSVNRYAYGSNNPYKFRDADGQVVETIIDVVSLGLSIAAFKEDPTIVNGLGLAYDAIATATPFLPAGFGILKNAGRAADALGDAARVADKAGDAARRAVGIGEHAGESIAARSVGRDFNAAERAEINRIGSETGCHTCGAKNPSTKSGNFVPDHQPPSALNPTGTPQRLYPQCINCSREQGLEIARQLQVGGP